MNSIIRSIRERFLGFGVYINRTPDIKVIKDFVSELSPVKTEHRLIRVGGDADGGYLIPDDLVGITQCFSPGVSNIANFEIDLTARGIECFLADYSVEKPPFLNELMHFEKKFLGSENDDVYMTLGNWMSRYSKTDGDLILQMDIEGSEYEVIYELQRETLLRFRIIVIEFHRLDNLFNKSGFDLIKLTFRKLLKDFSIVHIHPNNCSPPIASGDLEIPPVLEFTFLRNDRIAHREPQIEFPHPLDRPNVSEVANYKLPRCWY